MSELSVLRESLIGLPLTRLSAASGLPRQTIKAIRDGKTDNPGILTVEKIRGAVKIVKKARGKK